jgi:cell division protein FtsB
METQSNEPANKRDKNKIYFLILVIIALLGINGYMYFKDKKQEKQFVSVSTEKDQLKLEVEKIEVELDRVNLLNVTLNDRLLEEQKIARDKISQLKTALQRGQITEKELEDARKQILNLKDFVKNYNNQITALEKENAWLKTERDSLKTNIKDISQQAEDLTQRNKDLSQKVKTGAALKASNIRVTAYKVKSSGKITDVTRASTATRLTINFDVVANDIAEKRYHAVYLRVIDPSGNLIALESNVFEVSGQQMQYSKATEIDYKNENPTYKIDWDNPNPFMKGTYNILLYADGYTMGKSQITLR